MYTLIIIAIVAVALLLWIVSAIALARWYFVQTLPPDERALWRTWTMASDWTWHERLAMLRSHREAEANLKAKELAKANAQVQSAA
jgi:hypothetical protein